MNRYERQAAFLVWVADLCLRAQRQGIRVEALTEFETEWMGRVM
jgi:hypothetical protein